MAKTSGALFSTDARGSVGGITFQHAYRRKVCRGKPIPLNRKSTAQLTVRAAVAKTVQFWQELITSQKELWKAYTNGQGNTGYHAFIQQFIKRTLANNPQYQLPPDHGFCIVGEHLVGELTVGGVWQDP